MFDRLKNLFSSFQSTTDSVIGVDIGSAYLKVVQLKRKAGKAVLETYGELALGPYEGLEVGRATKLPPDKLAEALRDIIREAHVTTTRGAIAIPFASSLVTIIDIPPLEEKDLSVAVPIEARKYVPVPISEVNLEWWVVPKEPTRNTENAEVVGSETSPSTSGKTAFLQVLIAAIHNEALTRFQDVAKGSGVEASFFEIELFSTIRALLPQDLEAHAVLDFGAGETKLYIIDRGLLRLSHSISHGAQELTLALSRSLNITMDEAEKLKRTNGLSASDSRVSDSLRGILDFVFSETDRGLRNFEHRFGRKVKDIILSGGGANLLGLEEFAGKAFSVPIFRANPFTHVEAPAFLDEVLKSVGPEFSVAIGLAFRKLQEEG